MGIASIVLNVLSVVMAPMVLAVAVMTTDSPRTSKGHFRAVYWFLGIHGAIVLGSIAGAWGLRSAGRAGTALLASLAPVAWIVLAFALLFVLGFGRRGDEAKS